VEEAGVVAGDVRPLLRLVLDREPLRARPREPLVDARPRLGLEREVVQPDRVPVVRSRRRRLRLSQRQRRADTLSVEIDDALAALAEDVRGVGVAERSQKLLVERQAALERGDDEVEVVEAAAGDRRRLRRAPESDRGASPLPERRALLARCAVERDEEPRELARLSVATAAGERHGHHVFVT
jgi:hypothetical protein